MELEKLEHIGFSKIGQWECEGDDLVLINHNNVNYQNAIYTFVCEDIILYVGKTTNTIKKRFHGYKKPGVSQNTNIGINRNLKNEIKKGNIISIFVFEDKGLLKYGDFIINLAEGLEKSIIESFNPKWNGNGKKED